MSTLWKRSLISLVCVGLLSACVEEEETADTSTSTFVVYSMNEVSSGYQTFQQRNLSYDDIDVDEDDSTYVYKNRETGDSTSVVFNSANSSSVDTEELVVSAITDINDIYTALQIEDVTIKVESVNHTGDYVLVQDKITGDLYPVVNGSSEPIDNSNITDDMYWISNDRYANNADEDRIYLNDMASDVLYIYEFDGEYFTYIETFSYAGNDFWIDENGDILVQSSSDSKQFYYYEQDDYDDPDSKYTSYAMLPFLYDGDFFSARSGNSTIYELEQTTSAFYFSSDTSWTNDDDYEPAINSARRGNYEMSPDCKLYEFNDDNPYAISIDLISDFDDEDVENGQLAVAGQNALFCVHAASSADTASPIILTYDLDTEEATNYTVSDGDLSDATDDFTVVSDTEVMFSEDPTGTFEEYYVDLEDETDETIEVTESSIVLLQRLED